MTPFAVHPPDHTEAAQYYQTYISQVPAGDVRDVLDAQADDLPRLLAGLTEDQSHYRYAPEKWTIRQVISHINDTERVFSFRAFWFGRGYEQPMPSFDQDIAMAVACANERSLADHVEEFRALRAATAKLFRSMPRGAWDRRGVASDNPVTVRALAYITAGHVAHHARILRERYLTH